MRPLTPVNKVEQRERLANDVATFLANGGSIHEATFQDTKMYRDMNRTTRKTMAERAYSIDPARRWGSKGAHRPYSAAQIEARKNHRWRTDRLRSQ